MKYDRFLESIRDNKMPPDLNSELRSLWLDATDDWNQAHSIAQNIHTEMGSHIHAYLHRKEGDKWNANYWYRQAGQEYPDISLAGEWENLVRANL